MNVQLRIYFLRPKRNTHGPVDITEAGDDVDVFLSLRWWFVEVCSCCDAIRIDGKEKMHHKAKLHEY